MGKAIDNTMGVSWLLRREIEELLVALSSDDKSRELTPEELDGLVSYAGWLEDYAENIEHYAQNLQQVAGQLGQRLHDLEGELKVRAKHRKVRRPDA